MPARKIELKLDVGDRVYVINKRHTWNSTDIVCPVCNGTGTFIAPTTGTQRHCPGVSGYSCRDGYMVISDYQYYPRETEIAEISIASDSVTYLDSDGDPFDGVYYEHELYTTIEEAQAACDWRNAHNGS